MLINKHTSVAGQKTILVPYRKEHVPKYHAWMQSEELQRLTASIPLTLEEEYEMQKSWMMDENKCTFIILDKEKYDRTKNEIESMIGDTNLFFANMEAQLCTEIEIMVAEPWARGRKCGLEALLLMLLYGIEVLSIKEFIAKISEDNNISLNMFKNLGFIEVSHSNAFKEFTLCKIVDNEWTTFLKGKVGPFNVLSEN